MPLILGFYLMIFLIVPHNQEAICRHDYGVEDPDIMTIISLSEKDIPELWQNGFFDQLNKELNIMIDIAEDEKIVGKENLEKALTITHKYLETESTHKYLLLFKDLLEEAIERDTELNIYF